MSMTSLRHDRIIVCDGGGLFDYYQEAGGFGRRVLVLLCCPTVPEGRFGRAAAVTLSRCQSSACAKTSRPADRPAEAAAASSSTRKGDPSLPSVHRANLGRQDPSSAPSLARPASRPIAILPSSPVRAIRNRHALKSNFSWVRSTSSRLQTPVTPASSVVWLVRYFPKKKKINWSNVFCFVFLANTPTQNSTPWVCSDRPRQSSWKSIRYVPIYHVRSLAATYPRKCLNHRWGFCESFDRTPTSFKSA